MKRNLIVAVLAMLLAIPAQAQYRKYDYRMKHPVYRQGLQRVMRGAPTYTYYGFRVGVGGNNIYNDNLNSDGMKAGLNVAFTADFMLLRTEPLFLETGLQFTEKGGKFHSSANSLYGNDAVTCTLDYLEVPLVLKYQVTLNRDMAVTPFFGGYVACGVGGKIKDHSLRVAEPSFSSENFRRFDGGLRLGCGLMLDRFYVEVGYDAGLANILQDSFDTAHTGSLFANVGVNF